MKKHAVVGICNALVDILIAVEEQDLVALNLTKGVMHLVDESRQKQVLARFGGKSKATELGGSALNALRTLAQLGHKTVFAGMVGEDEFGARVRGRMNELGIGVRIGSSREATGTCVILVTPDGERTMNTCLGASRLYTELDVPHDDIADAKVLHFCGYQWDTDGQKRAIAEAIKSAHAHDTLVSFDVADPFAVGRSRDEFLRVIADQADVVFANREEAKMLYGSDPMDAARRIASHGAIAVIKLGAEGAFIRQGDHEYRIPAVKTDVVDTTAAGDMFAAGFLNGFLQGRSHDISGHMAATVASDVISRVGANVSTKALQAIKAL